jgi:lipopolysaccharide/colanic/teichoic acid biosynthesis glycosyltransferase
MKLTSVIKYAVRFIFLQLFLSSFSIYFFDNFLIKDIQTKDLIYKNLIDDIDRFLPIVNSTYVTVDALIVLVIFVFLIILYSTKFYTYVNELSYSINKNLLDEYFQLYLLWTSYIFAMFFLFRFENISRGYLLLFSLIVPIFLLAFRNTELISSLLGRSVTGETYLSINLDKNSSFRNLRILTFRKSLSSLYSQDINNSKNIIDNIDNLNKEEKINLIVLNLEAIKSIDENLEKYLINTNKKVLIISENKPDFKTNFLYRQEFIDENYFTYFNNDIQYGAKYILKRIIDIVLSIFGLIIFMPIILLLSIYILSIDGYPFFVKQKRVGLHGQVFDMYKFRTMHKNSHKQRASLDELNKSDGPLFKIENDPRILKGLLFARKFSLDELLQFINVLKGEMSIVGPRPLFDDDTQLFDTNYMRRLNVLPGITGLLQINERNTSDFSIWYKYDIEYIENWSLYLDLKIILKTPISLFTSKTTGL